MNSTLALISGLGLGLGLETSGLGLGLGLEALGLGLETPGLVNIPGCWFIRTDISKIDITLSADSTSFLSNLALHLKSWHSASTYMLYQHVNRRQN